MSGNPLLSGLPFIFAVLVGIIFTLITALIYFLLHKKNDFKLYTAVFIFAVYIFMVYVVLFKPYVISGKGMNYEGIVYYNFEVFKTISGYIENQNYVPLIGGVLVTLPLFPVFYSVFYKIISVKKCAVFSLIFVILIEPLQLIINILTAFPNKAVDIDDFILNIIGFFIGYIITVIWCKCLRKISFA